MLARPTGGALDVTIWRVERQPVTVLVVDDLASFRAAAASVIAAADSFALAGQAGTGEEALAFLQQRSVGLVLMDVNMPGMGGIRAAEQIRSRFPEVLVVLLSIHHLAELPAAASSCGAEFCHKGRFGPDELEALWDRRAQEQI